MTASHPTARKRSTWTPWIALVGLALVASLPAAAQPPAGYYDTADTTNATTLRDSLHAIIDDHTRFPYTSSSTDTWDILNLADEDPSDTGRVVDVYKNASYAKISGGTGAYNREHSWPKSYGFPSNVSSNYPYTDCHHLFVSDSGYNSSRSNKPYRTCHSGCSEKTTDFTDGRGGGSGTYVGNSNWTEGSFTQGTWETWPGRRGDVARALLYMDVRYEGGSHGGTGHSEPDLILTDDENLIDGSNTGSNESIAYMGMLSILLQWHQEDPVDSREVWRNEVVYSYQGNRNPFIDHPEWVACVFENLCDPDTTPPAAPTGLAATAGDGSVSLTWNANGESDLAGYDVFRSTTAGGPYSQLNGALVTTTSYDDTGLANGTTYYYVIRAEDTSGNESGDSNEASATPSGGGGGGGGSLLLSEVFYDASGGDDGLEWVELYNAGATAIDLSGYSLGAGGTDYTYSKAQLSGTIAAGATFVVGGPTSSSSNASPSFDLALNFSPDLQNSGSTADGVALFDVPAAQVTGSTVPIDAVVYGGSNSNGLIDESGSASSPEVGDASSGSSIERVDVAGSWRIQGSPTPNSVDGTDLASGDVTPPAAPTGLAATPGDGTVDLDWSDNTEPDLAGYNVYRSTSAGGPYGKVNGALVAASAFADGGLANGTTYHYVVTAVDNAGNESANSAEASATPSAPSVVLVLSEVFYDASGGDDGLEWVELYNAGSGSIDLSGYSLGWGGTDYTYGTAQLSGTIAAGQTFVVGGPTSSSSNANPSFDQSLDLSPDVQNSGSTADGVALFDVPAAQVTGSTVPIDAVVYGGSNSNNLIDESGAASAPEVGDASSGSSIERTDLAGAWRIQGSPTPNSVAGTGL